MFWNHEPWGHGGGNMAMQSIQQFFKFVSIPLAMMSFVLLASQAGGFVLRTDTTVSPNGSLALPLKQ
jgi:hypothetical protein